MCGGVSEAALVPRRGQPQPYKSCSRSEARAGGGARRGLSLSLVEHVQNRLENVVRKADESLRYRNGRDSFATSPTP